MYERCSAIKLGQNKGRARVYLQGRWLLRANFAPGAAIHAEFAPGKVVLSLSAEGERHVSGKSRGGEQVPVIDVTGQHLVDALGGMVDLEVRCHERTITITPSKTAKAVAARCRNGLEGSAFSGGGFLSEAAKQAGLKPAFAIEVDERYAEVYEANHPEALMFNMSISEVPFDKVPQVETLTMGIPCDPFSRKRTGRQGLPPEAHDLGDMTFWALRLVEACNPYNVVIEQVPEYLRSGAYWLLRHALGRNSPTPGRPLSMSANTPRCRLCGGSANMRRMVAAGLDAHHAWAPKCTACNGTGVRR